MLKELLVKELSKAKKDFVDVARILKEKFNDFNGGSRLKGINIRNLGGDEKRFKQVKNTLSYLPDSVLDLLRDKQTAIFYSPEDSKFEYADGFKAAGFYNFQHNHIFIHDSGEKTLNWQKTTIIHEVGHLVDFSLASGDSWLSHGEESLHRIAYESKAYYIREFGDEEVASYYHSNIKEVFAQGFAEYIMNRFMFQHKCPNQVGFFDLVMGELQAHYDHKYN